MQTGTIGWFHRYPARFAPQVVDRMIATCARRLARADIVVLDPFAGTGATLARARQLGHQSIGVELSHLGVLIAQTRLEPPSDINELQEFAEAFSFRTFNDFAYPVDSELKRWIGTQNAKFLSHFLMVLDCIDDRKERRWLELAMSSALRPASIWLSGSIKPQIDPTRVPLALNNMFRASSRKLARDCKLEAMNSDPLISASMVKGTAAALPIRSESVDAIVSSPPYASMYDYFDVQRLSYLAFRWPLETRHQIGAATGIERDGLSFVPPSSMTHWYVNKFDGENTSKGRALRAYLLSMERHYHEAFRVLRDGGTAAYAVANSFRAGREFNLCAATIELLRRAGFTGIRWGRRAGAVKRILPAARNAKTGRFSSTGVVREVEERIIYATKLG